jgi:hypothetical protein
MSPRTVIHLRDRVSVNGKPAGRVSFFLSNGRILVKDDAGTSRAYWPDQLEIVSDNHHEESAPTCPVPAKLQEALEIVESLMSRTKNGATLVRLYGLISSALSDFFTEDGDTAAPFPAGEEHVYLSTRPEETFAGNPLPPVA